MGVSVAKWAERGGGRVGGSKCPKACGSLALELADTAPGVTAGLVLVAGSACSPAAP